jgi:hypothetical protein
MSIENTIHRMRRMKISGDFNFYWYSFHENEINLKDPAIKRIGSRK